VRYRFLTADLKNLSYRDGRFRCVSQKKERVMNKNTIQGKWDQVSGQAKQYFAKVGDTDLELLAKGKIQEFKGKVQEAYGKSEEETDRYIKDFEKKCGCSSSDSNMAA